jgi:hypothetical protein
MSNDINLKAKELVERFIQASVVIDDGETFYHTKPFCVAKQCALIAVERTIDTLVIVLNKSYNTESNNLINDEIDVQMLVKQAIENL